MAKTQAIGLDIGGTALRAAEVSTGRGGSIELVRYAEQALPPNAVRDGEIIDQDAVVPSLKALWAQAGFSSKDVILGVGNQHVAVRPLTMPRLPMDELQASLSFQVQDSLPMPVEEAVLGFYPTGEASVEQGAGLEGMLVAASRTTVMTNIRAVEAAGLKPTVVDLTGFALLRSMARGPLASGTVALVDIGARITTVVVATDAQPKFVRAVPTGAMDLADALSRSLSMPLHEAERELHSRGLAVAEVLEYRDAAGPFGDATRNLLEGVRNSISFYSSTNRQAPVATVVLSGGGCIVPGLGQSIASETRVRTLLGNPLEGLTVNRRVAGLENLRGREGTMAMPVGLGMGAAA